MLFEDFSSKVKSIFIELPGYSFSHGIPDTNNPDPLFIGRKKNIERLKEILSNTRLKTGAYLVTGYRGMGKSSYVQKVIDDLCIDEKSYFYLASKYAILYIFLIFIASFELPSNFLHELFYSIIYSIVLLIAIVLIVFYLRNRKIEASNCPVFNKDSQDKNIGRKSRNFFRIVVWKPFVVYNNTKIKERYKNISQFLYILSISFLIIQIFKLLQWDAYYCANFILFFLLIIKVLDYLDFYIGEKTMSDQSSGSFKNEYKIRVFPWFGKVFNYNNHIYVRINFGYDALREVDILRLIARNLRNEYANYLNSFTKNFLWKFVYIIFIFSLVSICYFNSTLYDYTAELKETINFNNYFPSQKQNWNWSPNIPTDKVKNIVKICNYIDYNLVTYYNKAVNFFFKYLFWGIFDDVKSPLILTPYNDKVHVSSLIPRKIDYFFILYLFIFWYLFRFITHLRIFNLVTHKTIIKDLDYLNDRIQSEIKTEKSTGINGKDFFSFINITSYKSRNFPIADVREIEQRIIEILDKIEIIPSFMFKPTITFVFDELDKIEPQISVMTGEKETAESALSSSHHFSFTPEGARERQYAIQRLLSNLKYFLTKAKAKFIFIAGREMYDAALADVSDRNFFIGSIFNDVIYIDSFLSDPTDNRVSDITSLIEKYVCKAILPKNYAQSDLECNLTVFRKYLENYSSIIDDKNTYREFNDTFKQKFIQVKIEKIIFTLHHFIMYLTHVSNGSPKKLSSFFERHVCYHDGSFSDEYIMVKAYTGKSTLFLQLSPQDQHKIGLVHYLASPITYKILNTIKDFDDKLLYSASFLIDHIFKFHRHGFSYRNIENAPELIEINKTPELRSFIATILQYVSQIHIQKLTSGLYDFRFNKRISHEIAYLSKISEDASAAFNFTLDESQAIKYFYHRTLEILLKRSNNNQSHKPDELVRSTAIVHIILGDLHFYDDEFNEAIIEYMNASQFLRSIKAKELSVSLFILLIRNLLKLGLSYEKRKTYDSAFLVFAELSDALIEFRDIDLDSLGFEEFVKGENIVLKKNDKKILAGVSQKGISPAVEGSTQDEIPADEFVIELSEHLNPRNESIINKIATYEGLKLVYYPLLAKLQILEKSHMGGITATNVNRIINEFEFLQRTIVKKDRILMESEFYNKIGNILYYKNGNFYIPRTDYYNKNLMYKDCNTCCENNLSGNVISHACNSCYFYYMGLVSCMKYSNDETVKVNDETKFDIILERLLGFRINNNIRNRNDVNSLKTLASILSNLADVIFSCSPTLNSPDLTPEFLNTFVSVINNYDIKKAEWDSLKKNIGTRYNDVLILLYLSAYYFKKADELKQSIWQYTKMLYVINSFIKNIQEKDKIKEYNIKRSEENGNKIDSIESKILSKIIRDTHGAYENIHFSEIERFKYVFNRSKLDEHIPLYRLTINTDLIEPMTIFYHLLLKLEKENDPPKDLFKLYFKSNMVSPYSSYLNVYNKIIQLRFKAKMNYHLFKYMINSNKDFIMTYPQNKKGFDNIIHKSFIDDEKLNERFSIIKMNSDELFTNNPIINHGFEFLIHLICDSIYCLHEIVISMNTYGRSYNISSSFQAMIHENLAEWCYYYKLIYFGKPDKTNYPVDIKDKITKLIGSENIVFLNANYQCEIAHKLYYSALETHSEGRAYHNMIEDMSFLNEDFNDGLYHFFASLERFLISTGKIQEKIKNLACLIKYSDIYNPEYYKWIK